jgi:hypothetical protein
VTEEAEPVISMEHHGTILVDDDVVLVVDTKLTPAESQELPPQRPMLLVGLTPADLNLASNLDLGDEAHILRDEGLWRARAPHFIENIGLEPSRLLVVEFKR